ncbi:MAG: error-prone DNA polymerase [Gammaproteobacteria bacterium]|nr:error-prone DNA polymerase [Gammaproteobacteria bacterium]
MSLPPYAELHCLSNFTFLRGASHPQELVAQAHALRYSALALTDECTFAGAVRAHVAARELGCKLIVGTELKLADGLSLLLLADDIKAYRQISALITCGRRRMEKGAYHLERSDVEALMTTGLAVWLPRMDEAAAASANWFADVFPGRGWIGVGLFYSGADGALLEHARDLSRSRGLPLVAVGDVHAHCRERRPLLDTVTAIRLGTTLGEAGRSLFASSERYLRPRARLARIYPADLLRETLVLAERCNFCLSELHYDYPRELVPEGKTPSSHLRSLTEAGMRRRWPQGAPEKVRRLIDHELALITELNYEAFFLTVYDIVEFARARGILCQGRGSAANSAVCYSLGITEVDPARMEMLFERFISRERNEPPDIDVDFEHERREEVIQYVYGKYGRERAALAATVVTYKLRSAVRDVGKALGLSLDQVDRLAKNMYWWDRGAAIPERLREVGFDPDNPVIERLVMLVAELIGFPRHLSQHVGGFVISDHPLSQLVPVENAAMPERTVIQWDKDDLETLGLLKVDCLCLGMLTAIRKSFDLIRDFDGRVLTLETIPAEDPATYAMIQKGDTVGVFQIESRAQMAMLPRLKPACYYDLVIEVAIIRPGPIQGEMVHPYLRRRRGEEEITYPSEEVRGVLERTLGVPLFQEQVIKLAMVAAGFSPGKADQLRRSMATWKRNGGIERFRKDLIHGMLAHGYKEEFAERIFNQIQGFGEYGFPESHSASFALLAYVSAWLKRHEPAAFTAALLNSQPMGFYAPSQLVQDAAGHGVEIRPADVQLSIWDCTLETTGPGRGMPAVRLGLRMVKGLPADAGARLVDAREAAGFIDVTDLARRAALDRGAIKALSRAGALKTLAGNRHQAGWAALAIEQPVDVIAEARIIEATPLLRRPSEGEDIIADYSSLGLTLGRHPLALLRRQLDRRHFITAEMLGRARHGESIRTVGLVIMRQRPGTATGVVFVTLEDETGIINLIVWSSLVETQRRELLNARLLGVTGEVQREGEVIHVIAKRLEDHTALLGRLATQSRDFH